MEKGAAAQPGKRVTLGVLAHVDAGKTTLSEQLLYLGGALRSRGRVDHGDAFLDAEPVERERGITVFSGQAEFSYGGTRWFLLDTPGHTDFAPEMERALQVLDYAVLVVSCAEGVQAHTETLWRLLAHYRLPAFLFLNKTDRPGASVERTLKELRKKCSPAVLPMDGFAGQVEEPLAEELAALDDALLEQYLEGGVPQEEWQPALRRLVRQRKLFPCFSGSALQSLGVEEFLRAMDWLTETGYEEKEKEPFSAVAYKVRRADARLTYLKVTAGTLACREEADTLAADGSVQKEKVTALYRCQGEKRIPVQQVRAGELCCAAGFSALRPGEGLGARRFRTGWELAPMLLSRVQWAGPQDPRPVLAAFRTLEEEEPALSVEWNEALQELRVHVMGEVQLEILQEILRERFQLEVTFGECRVMYQETIRNTVHACGHFEPLRHYAEVHFLLSPGPRGSGITFESLCPLDVLDKNWQNLIRTHVFERPIAGVLTGAPVTDLHVALLTGRAHLKHTEGGDFREAVYRALRQGLMQADCLLLEPWCAFRISVPQEYAGRVLADVQRLCGTAEPPLQEGGAAVVTGRAPAAAFFPYQKELTAFTRGRGALSLRFDGCEPCHNEAEVLAASPYRPEADTENPAGSVFCSHGAGYFVPWQEAASHMHCDWRKAAEGRISQELFV